MKPSMQIPWTFALLPSLLLVTSPTLGQELDEGEFEMWTNVEQPSHPEKNLHQGTSGSSSLASHAGQIERKPLSGALSFHHEKKDLQKQAIKKAEADKKRKEKVSPLIGSVSDQFEKHYFIRFGAGASWMMPLRLADMANGERLMSEFSVSWSPVGMIAEIGMDLGIARDNVFDLKPNLKFFFLNNRWFSVYLEGGCDLMFLAEGREVGIGTGLGFVLGILENLALEIKASAEVFYLSEDSAKHLLDLGDELSIAQVSNFTVFPSLTARIVARF